MNLLNSCVSGVRRLVPAIAAAAALSLATSAPAQLGDVAGFADLASQDYLHRDMILFQQGLDLDDSQRLILENLFEDYLADFEAGWNQTQQRINDMMSDIRSAEPDTVMRMILQPFEDWRQQKEQLKQTFEANVRSVLNQQQLERWPAFERQMTREKRLHEGRLSGESVNLFHVVRDLRLDERSMQMLEPIMEEYAIALHSAIESRTRVMRELQADFMRMFRRNDNPAAQATMVKRQIDHRVAVRDVNDTYRERIAASLPHEKAEQFISMALERGYPRVYRRLPAMDVYRQAMEIEDLDEEILAAIQDLWLILQTEMEVMNNRIMTMVRDFEPRQMANQAELYAARQTGESVERLIDPTREELRNRDSRAQYYVELLQDLLTDEQFASISAGQRWQAGQQRADRAAAAQRLRDRADVDERRRELIEQRRQQAEERGRERPSDNRRRPPARDGSDRGRGDR